MVLETVRMKPYESSELLPTDVLCFEHIMQKYRQITESIL